MKRLDEGGMDEGSESRHRANRVGSSSYLGNRHQNGFECDGELDCRVGWLKGRGGMASETLAIGEVRQQIAMTKQEAAHMLGVSLRTIDRLIALKELQVRRLGRRVLIPRSALESLLHRDHPTRIT